MRGAGRRGVVAAVVAGLALGLLVVGGGPAMAQGDEAWPSEAVRAKAQRDYDRAVRLVRARKPAEALEAFEAALPGLNTGSDLFYNLVQVAEALKRWDKVSLYAQGFLMREPQGDDAREIRSKLEAAVRHLERAERPLVRYVFDVEPAGTMVTVDHVPVAANKVTEVLLLPGKYTARAAQTGHEPWEAPLEVKAGAPETVTAALVKKIYTGTLTIVTTPAEGVTVFLDDERVGTTPLEPLKLPTLRYLVRFEKEGYATWVRYVTIERDGEHSLEPELERE